MGLIFFLILGFAVASAIINAVLGSDRGMSYFDMILTGVIFTPLMPLFICVTALILDKK
jgi:hypothetical protein